MAQDLKIQARAEEDPIEGRIRKVRRRRSRRALLLRLLVTAAAVYLAFGVCLGVAVVEGDSMTPALEDGDMTLFLRIGATYQIGDVVLVKMDDGTEQVKRIVALPGQTVEIRAKTGELLVDGEPLEETYVYDDTYAKTGVSYPLTLGEDEYFVLGDHREDSLDSRSYGSVRADQLDGRMLCILFRWTG